MNRVELDLGYHKYPVLIGSGILKTLGEEVRRCLPRDGRFLLVTDEGAGPLYSEECLLSLKAAGFEGMMAVIPQGEESKSLERAASLYNAALDGGLDRSSFVVALGGGVVGDLAGFVAATYLRGIPFVQVPTSLLAQVDSGVGGKVAVNLPRGKNLVGAFHQPLLVLADLCTLKTLAERHFYAGFMEVLKTGIIWEESFFCWLEQEMERLLEKMDQAVLEEAVARTIAVKGEVVGGDERERGRRRILNFGHTFGHALEAATGYRYYLHGEGVHIGMRMACAAAFYTGLLEAEPFGRLTALLDRLPYLPAPAGLKKEEILKAMFFDKKREGDTLVFILPRGPGKVGAGFLSPEIIGRVVGEYLHGSW